jgi:2-polyprenyl-6-methoxyphenol hydroxylase-like FAD-dependent oxidoreductase
VEHHPAQQLREHLVDQFHRHRRIMPRTVVRESPGQRQRAKFRAPTIDVEIEFKHDILPWSNRETTATTFRLGRVFLAGDAAHTMPTTGGLGMNTGIQDSFDLAWKLDAVLSGWGGKSLLDTYDPERRAAVTRSAGLASSIYQDWVETRRHHQAYWTRIAAGGADAARAKAELGEHLVTTFAREFNNIPAPLGYHYADSAI